MPGPLEYNVLNRTVNESLRNPRRISMGKEKRTLQLVSNRLVNVGPGTYDTAKLCEGTGNRSPSYSIGKVSMSVKVGGENAEVQELRTWAGELF